MIVLGEFFYISYNLQSDSQQRPEERVGSRIKRLAAAVEKERGGSEKKPTTPS
jgi:hypothetical protein